MHSQWKDCNGFSGCRLKASQMHNWVLEKARLPRNLLSSMKTRQLWYAGHVIRHNCFSKDNSGDLSQTRNRGRPKIVWFINIRDWMVISLKRQLCASDTEMNRESSQCDRLLDMMTYKGNLYIKIFSTSSGVNIRVLTYVTVKDSLH